MEPLEQQIKECKGREKTEKIEISRKKRSRSMSCSSNTISSEICEEENSAARESKRLRPSHRNEQETFSNYFKLLMEFKAEFGHCEVPPALARSNDSKYSSLALWCTKIQQCYKTMKLGKKSRVQSFTTLSASRIRRLEAAGFEWKFSKKECTFDNHIKQLVAYKAEFGHCDVPRKVSRHSRYYGLSQWCNSIRSKGRKPTDLNLSPAKIRRLESIGFRLKLMTFDDYFTQLEEYKAEFGHCNVPYDRSDDYDLLSNEEDSSKHKALRKWCFAIRSSSTMAEEEGEQPRCSKLSPSQIQRLEDLGFHFDMPKTRDFSFYERFEVLMKYKAEFGNVDVPSGMSRDSRYYLLSRWCLLWRATLKAIKAKEKPRFKLSKAQIKCLKLAGLRF